MKGSKMFGKSIIAIALSLILIISAVAPLTVMGSENYGGGSNGTALGQYRYYSVKSGDTLASIAQKNGVTISDIMTYNNLTSEDVLYKGQVLKLPITSTNAPTNIVSSKITLKAKDASVKGLISTIAYNAGYTVVFKGTDSTISIELEDVSPMKALDYVTRFASLSYLKDGNTILVSTPEDLNTTFVDSLVLTKFTFQYITSSELLGQATALGLSSMKIVSQSNNKRDVWISAYPKEMAKLKELVEILDASENISLGSNGISSAFTPIELEYISAAEFSSLLTSLGLHAGITMSSYPQTLFVYVSGVELSDIMTIKKVVDTEAAMSGILEDAVKPDGSTGGDTSTETTPSPEATVFEKIDFKNISRTDAETLIAKSGEFVNTYGHSRMTKSLWLFGTAAAIENVKTLIASVDEKVASAASTVHTYTAKNCTVDELMNRLAGVNYDTVSFYKYDHSEITNTIIVYCDDVTWNNEIYDLLVALDTVDTGEKMWIPIDAFDQGVTIGENTAVVQSRYDLMVELYPEVFDGVEYKIVAARKTVESYKAILYVKVTSDQATRMMNLLDTLDNV